MKYSLISCFRMIIAALTAFFVSFSSLFSCSEPQEEAIANLVSGFDSESADYMLNIDPQDEIHDISDLLFGIFFEDINFAADGGLYAEMVANRSFEYTEIAADDEFYGYSAVGDAR